MPGGGNLVRSGRYRKTPRTPRSAHARYYYTRSLVLGSPVKRRLNSPQTRCQSAPKVMDSHSRSASPREPSRPQHRPPSPPSSPAGFDNRAYQHDDADPNHNDSFASNQPHQNGHTKEANGDTKLEAVNLELINLTPKNGNAKKKDVEVDMNATNPYDEYFVPVNEHRKYMRGEKLYVTADKRGEKGGCKRPLCWTLLGLVVAAIVALIVLAATGILFTNSPTPLEPYNTSVSSARALGGIGHVHNHDHDHGHDHHDHEHDHHDHEHDHHDHSTQPPTTQHTPEIQNNEESNLPNIPDESGDMSVYVPKTVEGELRIDNKDFVPALEDPESEEYKEFTATFSDALKHALFDRNTIDNGENEITVEVVAIKEGSIIVTYRIHWRPRSNAESNQDLLTANTLKTTLTHYLDNNNRMINVYHIAEDKMATRPVLDLCQISNNDCEYGCEFDDTTLDFTCTCPHGQMQDMISPKKCIHILENSDHEQHTENHTEKELNVLTLEDTDRMTAIPEEEKPDLQTVHKADDETAFDWKEPQHITPEPTTENVDDVNYSHIFGHPRSKNDDIEAETTKPEPMPTAEPEPEPKPELEPTAEPKPEPEPTAEPKPEPEPMAEPKPEAVPTAEPKPNEAIDTKSTLEQSAGPKTEIKSDSESMEGPELTAAQVPVAKPKPEPESEPTPVHEGITELKHELPIEPESSSEPNSSSETEASFDQSSEPKPQPEPTAEPNINTISEPISETEPGPEPIVTSKLELDTSKEFNLEPETKIEPDPTSEPNLTVIASEEKHKNNMVSNYKFKLNEEEVTTHIPQILNKYEHIHQDATEGQDDIKPELELKPIMLEDNVTPGIALGEPLTTTQFSSNEEYERQPTEHTNMEKTGSNIDSVEKSNDMNMPGETTTARISISEPNVINEPSYEPKPEIISILRDHNEINNLTLFGSNDDDDDDYLSNNEDAKLNQNHAHESPYVDFKTSDDRITGTEVTSILNNEESRTEQRSSKNLNSDFNIDTTTTKDTMNSRDDVTFEFISKNGNKIAESTTKISEEIPTTILVNEKMSEPTENSFLPTTISAETTIKNEPHQVNHDNTHKLKSQLQLNDLEKSITTTQEIPTMEVQKQNEFSINQQIQESVENKNLLDGLENKNENNIQLHTTTTESHMHDENDVTFDAITMLYNRTSKSMENAGVQQVTESIASSDPSETTDSDWLSEPVTEVNYKETMNKMESHDTTETSINKIDEVINHSVSEDDFEPDYLNNMGSNVSKMPEQDEPLYGMTHDYDNDDLRVKRVNDRREPEETDSIKNLNGSNGSFESSSIVPVVGNSSLTTVKEYIYKSSEKFQNTSISDDEQLSDVIKNNNKDQDEMMPASITETKVNKDNITDDVLSIPATTVATTMISLDDGQGANIAMETTSDNTQNSTQVNNLNVTIYEISKHSGNQSHSTPNHTHSQSAEYEDHETEMNPFLPEVENNKILVKKLQEGHDLEPVNVNETQNENIEDHMTNISDNASSTNMSQLNNDITKNNITTYNREATDSLLSPKVSTSTTTEENALFNDLLLASNSQSTEDDSHETTEGVKNSPSLIGDETTEMTKMVKSQKVLPISAFFLDTDDLDVPKHSIVLENHEKNEVLNSSTEATTTSTPKIETENDDNQYLSVVPIEPEALEDKQALKNYNSENIQELNYISDSPKKSDRRTLDTTNLESIINNEA